MPDMLFGASLLNRNRSLSPGSNPNSMPPLTPLKIMQCRMRGDTIIPHHDRSFFPLDSSLQIRTLGQMIIQKLQNSITLLFLESNDIPGELFIHKEGFLARDGMDADHRVDIGDRGAADVAACRLRIVGLFVAGVDCRKGLEERLELRGKAFVGFDLGEEEGVTAGDNAVFGGEIEDE